MGVEEGVQHVLQVHLHNGAGHPKDRQTQWVNTDTDGINTIHKTHRNNSVVKSISTSSTHCCNDIYFLSKTLLIVSYMYMYFYLKLLSESKLDVCFHE